MPRSKNGQLAQGDSMAIEQQLKDCRPLPEIARGLGVAPSRKAARRLLALPRVLLRSDEVGPERQLREEPRRAVQGDPQGLVVRQADPGEAVGGVLAC